MLALKRRTVLAMELVQLILLLALLVFLLTVYRLYKCFYYSRERYRGEIVEPINHTFVQDVVEIFKRQRIRGYHFAVIILSQYQHVTLNIRPSYVTTNNTSPTHPPDLTLGNYIVARPDGPHHAEVLLLCRFPTLLARNTPGCKSILLYSWFLPCQHCTEKIVHVLGQYTTTHRVTVVYTSTASESQERRNKLTMEKAGITVIKRQYDGYLASAGD